MYINAVLHALNRVGKGVGARQFWSFRTGRRYAGVFWYNHTHAAHGSSQVGKAALVGWHAMDVMITDGCTSKLHWIGCHFLQVVLWTVLYSSLSWFISVVLVYLVDKECLLAIPCLLNSREPPCKPPRTQMRRRRRPLHIENVTHLRAEVFNTGRSHFSQYTITYIESGSKRNTQLIHSQGGKKNDTRDERTREVVCWRSEVSDRGFGRCRSEKLLSEAKCWHSLVIRNSR